MARQYPASKTQLRKLAELGISADGVAGYTDAARLLEKAGWDASGTIQQDAGDTRIDGRSAAENY